MLKSINIDHLSVVDLHQGATSDNPPPRPNDLKLGHIPIRTAEHAEMYQTEFEDNVRSDTTQENSSQSVTIFSKVVELSINMSYILDRYSSRGRSPENGRPLHYKTRVGH